MAEQWACDANGLVTNGEILFKACDLRGLQKIEKDSIVLWFPTYSTKVTWGDPSDQSQMFYFFKQIMIAVVDAERKNQAAYVNYREASLAAQRSIINEHIGCVK